MLVTTCGRMMEKTVMEIRIVLEFLCRKANLHCCQIYSNVDCGASQHGKVVVKKGAVMLSVRHISSKWCSPREVYLVASAERKYSIAETELNSSVDGRNAESFLDQQSPCPPRNFSW
jgi:hypothetical protein